MLGHTQACEVPHGGAGIGASCLARKAPYEAMIGPRALPSAEWADWKQACSSLEGIWGADRVLVNPPDGLVSKIAS